MLIEIILILVTTLLALVYVIGRYNAYYWKKRGVVFYEKNKHMGPFWDFLVYDRAMFEILHDLYKQYQNEPAVGFGSLQQPALYVTDIQNVQHVLQSDFQSFNHRSIDVSSKDLLSDNVLFQHGPRWKLVRQKMTPLFTAAKLKSMYYIMDKSAQDIVEFLKNNPERLKSNSYETITLYCNAAIGSAVFGISSESLVDSPFQKMAVQSQIATPLSVLQFCFGNLLPQVVPLFGIKIFGNFEEFFISAIKKVIRQREKEDVKRHDFADLCVSLQKNGTLRDPETNYEIEPTDELLAAQAFFFFLAGVEPTASATFGCLIELGRHPDVLKRVQEEIDEAFDKYNGKMSYDTVSDMDYLGMVLNESLRLYPPIGFLTRRCVKDSVLPVGNIKIDEGTKILTPVFEIHHDARYYPNPEVFDPERFAKDANIMNAAYMPFGKGGRLCIGERYARLQVLCGLVHLLRNFTVETHVGKGGIKYKKQQVQVRPTNIEVEFVPRNI